jgi:hypothetical protein
MTMRVVDHERPSQLLVETRPYQNRRLVNPSAATRSSRRHRHRRFRPQASAGRRGLCAGSTPPAPRDLAENAVPLDTRTDPAVSAAIRALIGSCQAADSRTVRTRALECLGYFTSWVGM